MGGGQGDKNEVDLVVNTGLTHRLTAIEVIPQHGEAPWLDEIVMGRNPAFGGGGFN